MRDKLKIKIIIIFAIVLLIMPLQATSIDNNSNKVKESTTVYSVEAEAGAYTWQGLSKNPNMEYCRHGIACEFDDTTMTLTNASKGSRIQDVIWDVEYWAKNHYAVVLYDGQEVTEGELQVGMIIQIYHGDELYGEYTVEQLLTPSFEGKLDVQNQQGLDEPSMIKSMAANSSNAYGYCLPLDNMNLNTHVPPYSYNRFSEDANGNYAGGHRGIDIMWSGIAGTTIRAVKSGTVSFIQT